MSNKYKAQGTDYESFVHQRNRFHQYNSMGLEEGGIYDAGDVAFELPTGDWIVQECKWREKFAVHRGLAKAEAKIAKADLPFMPLATVLFWKRTILKPGNQRRSADGVGEVVVMTPDTFYGLLEGWRLYSILVEERFGVSDGE